MKSLNVFFKKYLVGKITEDQIGIGFQYSKEWLNSEHGFAISHSLPLQDQYFLKEGENFFGNLLPEGSVRDSLCQKLGISIDNDIALLERVGHECAGALAIEQKNTFRAKTLKKRQITEAEFSELINNSATVYSGLQRNDDFPFSLAGAQDKIPVVFEKGLFYRPSSDEPSTHIIKFAQTRFSYVPENEFICSLLLKSCGLPVPNSQLIKINSQYHYVIERYDRDPELKLRFHQEDFCQALGVSRKNKYESDSGLKFKNIFNKLELILDSKNASIHLDLLIRWQILNVLLGNCDGHLKNVSLLRGQDMTWGLAPFYDVVMTLIYPTVSKRLALSIGDQQEIGNLHKNHWQSFFASLGVSSPFYLKQISVIANSLVMNFENIRQYFEVEYGKSSVLDMMEKQLLENIRRVIIGIK